VKRGELDELYKDILIHVTSFFRDPDALRPCDEHVFPNLFSGQQGRYRPCLGPRMLDRRGSLFARDGNVGIYLAGNPENARQLRVACPSQIFATDISESSSDRARAGIYSPAAVVDISPRTLRRFFVKLDGDIRLTSVRRCAFLRVRTFARIHPF